MTLAPYAHAQASESRPASDNGAVLHFLIERARSLPVHILDGILASPFVWLAKTWFIGLWRQLRRAQREPVGGVIEAPFIASRTKVFGGDGLAESVVPFIESRTKVFAPELAA